jgi:hypothetical protein
MRFPLEAIPERVKLGDMAAAYQRFPRGMNADKLLEGLPDDLCPCAHWGYALKGVMVVRYKDGSQEEVRAGDVYYLPAGHTAEIREDFACAEFSPAEEFWRVMEHVAKKAQQG